MAKHGKKQTGGNRKQKGGSGLKSDSTMTSVLIGLLLLVIVMAFINYQKQNQQNQQNQQNHNNFNEVLSERYNDMENSVNSAKKEQARPVKVIINNNVNDGENPNNISFWGYMNRKSHERIHNPLLPPERSYEQTYGVPINIPSRGYSGGYQQVGMLYKDTITDEGAMVGNNSETSILPLYGQPTHNGSNKWNYYTTSDKYHTVKIPLTISGKDCSDTYGCTELYDDDAVSIPAYNGNYKVKIYNYDKPRYIPYVW